MPRIRSVDFLPEIYQTSTNKKFLNSTLDTLIQEPKLKQTQGHIGQRTGPGVEPDDSYVIEPSLTRTNYQLEPGIVFKNKEQVDDAITHPEIIDGLAVKGANVSNHDRLFASESYSWSPLIDFDKFINYSQYYWLPTGPVNVDVSAADILTSNAFEVTRDAASSTYDISDLAGINPIMTLVRGGTYTFAVNQETGFYIQTEPGISGTVSYADNITSREIHGLTNNGEDVGVMTFNVPQATDQDFFLTMTDIGTVSLASELTHADIDGKLFSDIVSIDSILDINFKTIVFINDPTFKDIYRINFVYDINGENPTVSLSVETTLNINEKFTIQMGDDYSNHNFYKNASADVIAVPAITAPLTRFYYQDGTDVDMRGVIDIIDAGDPAVIDVDYIIGRKNYTSPNGVVFTNGLKIVFRGSVFPSSYADTETEIEYYVEGIGTAIKLIPVKQLITPEEYTVDIPHPWGSTPFDTTNWDVGASLALTPEYLTINRASLDRNAWARGNRWFHIDVITQIAEINNDIPVLDNDFRAQRPIIEFEPSLRLFNHGTHGKDYIDLIDFSQTDALSNVHGAINGTPATTIDGLPLITGTRIIFANDADVSVRDKIYIVGTDTVLRETSPSVFQDVEVILLTEASDADNEVNDNVVVKEGLISKGKTYTFSDVWTESQTKTTINQFPLFNTFDINGVSFSNATIYPATTFVGTKLFSYKIGNGENDNILGFPLTFENIGNLGDIVFVNNLYADEFLFVSDAVSNIKPISDGYIHQHSTRVDYHTEIGWVASKETAHVPQVFNFLYDGVSLQIDVLAKPGLLTPAIKVFQNELYIDPTNYDITEVDGTTLITFSTVYTVDTKFEVLVISDTASKVAYYQVPTNLSRNVFNENTTTLTLGTVRNHYTHLSQNINEFRGVFSGSNNLRDLGDIAGYGNIIVQQSAPAALLAQFIRKNEYDFYKALTFASNQYEKIKNQILEWTQYNEVVDLTTSEILERALEEVNLSKSNLNAFFNSDMLPQGSNFVETEHIITAVSSGLYNTFEVYDFTSANEKALLIYHNDVLLIKDIDYEVPVNAPQIQIIVPTEVDDIITVKEYVSTKGSNIPSTPTKLGLYPKFKPEMYSDVTYASPKTVIRGHDGSITIAFGDVRDDVLFEFEKRIYANIKVNADIPVQVADVIPGQFRDTNYTTDEITEILTADLMTWLSHNGIDYKIQEYRADAEKTWNYSSADSKVDGELLKGNWRGIFNHYYDTDAPHIHPWEMLGLVEEPTWWQDRYGPAPYTSGNKVLWDDLEAGIIKDPTNEYTDARYVRPGLSDVIPVSSEGVILTPLQVMVANYTAYNFKKSWALGDEGPAESAWKRSSAYPFAMQRLMSLTKPAQYFSLMSDRDLYTFDDSHQQYLLGNRYRIDSRALDLVTDETRKHSYINWIFDYNKHYGYNSQADLVSELSELSVNLCYRMAAFTDKQKLRIFTDKSSPDSTNSSLLLPDESYNLLLHKNQPFDKIIYSSVMVQKVADGYAVYGNSNTDPYFKISQSLTQGKYKEYQVGNTASTATTIKIAQNFTDKVVFVPYGFVFASRYTVVDFLVSYEDYLKKQGLRFLNVENSLEVNWTEMAKEFIAWTDQDWAVSSVINLNPAADALEFERPLTVVDSLLNMSPTEQPQDQNRSLLNSRDYVVDRIDNNFKITTLNNKIISYLQFNLTSYEHLLVLDNTSIFNDQMYDPVLGIRQNRVKLVGFTTFDWNGLLDAQGFMLNQDNIIEWNNSTVYSKGEIVTFKNSLWIASQNVQPSEEFAFDAWVKTDIKDITLGLLPNLATRSDQMLDYYNDNSANLEQDIDLFALGLTGFRQRDYLASLDLDDISQVNIYKNMIRAKGTPSSLNLFKNAELKSGTSDYNIHENWAVREARFGASDSRTYVELQLDEAYHTADPTLVEVVKSAQSLSDADQIVPLNQIYKQNEKRTSLGIFPVVSDNNIDRTLPYAGFVERDDVDIAVFELADNPIINENLDDIINGTKIWVAKDTRYDWNVYRCSAVTPEVINVLDNLDGSLTIEFNGLHNLSVSDFIIIKHYDDLVNGLQSVVSLTSPLVITIAGALPDDQVQIEDEIGYALKLESVRVTQPSDLANVSFVNDFFRSDEKVWIDIDDNKRKVLNKVVPFALDKSLPSPSTATSYGTAIAQGYNDTGLVIGDPDYNSGQGIVYAYSKTAGSYVYRTQFELASEPGGSTAGFGNAVAMSSRWIVAGASASSTAAGQVVILNTDGNTFTEYQSITRPGSSSFGNDVAISYDENWIYIAEVGSNQVHSYQLIEYQSQEAVFTGDGVADGTSGEFDIAGSIIVATDIELEIYVGGVLQLGGIGNDYILNATNVEFAVAPADGASVYIKRKAKQEIISTGAGTYNTDELHAADVIDAITVMVSGVLQRPGYDYTFNGTTITFITVPVAAALIEIYTRDYFKFTQTITGPASVNFGESIATSSNGAQLVVSAPQATVTETNAGNVYVYNRRIERTIVTDIAEDEYTAAGTLVGNTSIFRNLTQLAPSSSAFNLNSDYSVAGQVVTIDLAEVTLNFGDLIDIDVNVLELTQTLALPNPTEDTYFGTSVDIDPFNGSVYIGAPGDSTNHFKEGSVTRFINDSFINGNLVGTLQNPVVTPGTIRINNIEITVAGITVEDVVTAITAALTPNVNAYVDNGYLVIELINKIVTTPDSRLNVLPGTSSAMFDSIGLSVYANEQAIYSPIQQEHAAFGSSVQIARDTKQLVVGANFGTTHKLTQFKTTVSDDLTLFDADTMRIVDEVQQSGAVYTYNLLRDETPQTAGKFVFGQQIYDAAVANQSYYGDVVSLVDGLLVVGAPTHSNDGRAVIFVNADNTSSWIEHKSEQDVVDVSCINAVNIYNKDTQLVEQHLDYIDPLNGKILGAAQHNIDYIAASDPADYTGAASVLWGKAQLTQLWWDVNDVRFLDYNQADVKKAMKLWGKVFPGSSVDVYQWIESNVPPSDYTGEGTPKDADSFLAIPIVTTGNVPVMQYYYWVKGITEINQNENKTLSAASVASYIEFPSSSGIVYSAFITSNVVGLYNASGMISDTDSILHVEYDKIKNDSVVFDEYSLIKEEYGDDFLSDNLYKKLLDSFVGVDDLGNTVPDRTLTEGERLGVSYRPRQSMFDNNFNALESYIKKANTIFEKYVLADGKSYPLLNSEEPAPGITTGEWDQQVANEDELYFQDLSLVPVGHKILVLTDNNNNGLWTIYEVTAAKTLVLFQVQTYDAKRFWNLKVWYDVGFDSTSKIDLVIDDLYKLIGIFPENGYLVKVLDNNAGLFEWHQFNDGAWSRVALENGTIELDARLYDYRLGRYGWDDEVSDAQYFDEEPVLELRQILRSINEEILVDELNVERNRLLISAFTFILSEQLAVDWLTKTSFIDVEHKIRSLLPLASFQKDNQNYVSDYINEAKPYHTKVKQFVSSYDGNDVANITATDFDCPAYFSQEFDKFISPVLDDGTVVLVTDQSNTGPSDEIWNTYPWNTWYDNRDLVVDLVEVINPGSGYTTVPEVVVTGTNITPAIFRAVIDGTETIIGIVVVDPGSGYVTAPILTITGGSGTGGTARARLDNNLVRTWNTTLKFDRYEYESNVTIWEASIAKDTDDLVRFNNAVYKTLTANTDPTFVPNKYEIVPASELSGIDRTFGYYNPGSSIIGNDLDLLIKGMSFPGIHAAGIDFTGNELEIDTNLEGGRFLDGFLGTLATDVNFTGGLFVDTSHGHSPEELVDCAIYDTLDMRVISRPGSDYLSNGHGYRVETEIFEFVTGTSETISFVDMVEIPVGITVVNVTTSVTMNETIDYRIDWNNQIITIEAGAVDNDSIKIFVSEVGGGDQLYRAFLKGNEIAANTIHVPADISEIKEVITFANGQRLVGFTLTEIDIGKTDVTYSHVFTPTETIVVVVLGVASANNESYERTTLFQPGQVVPFRYGSSYYGDAYYAPGRLESVVSATNFVTGVTYEIVTTGTTDFTLIGAADSNPGTQFNATGPGLGDGTAASLEFDMPTGFLEGTNAMNAIVEINGLRIRPPEARRYRVDGTITELNLPTDGLINQAAIIASEVFVYKNNVLLTDTTDYVLSASGDLSFSQVPHYDTFSFYDPDELLSRYVTFTSTPADGDVIEIYTTTLAEYTFTGNTLIFDTSPIIGDVIAVTTFGDTAELEVLTEAFAAPTATTVVRVDAWDIIGWDTAPWDLATTELVEENIFGIDNILITDPEKLWTTLNGNRLLANVDYKIVPGAAPVVATKLVSGAEYIIDIAGSTNFTIVGAPNNDPGTQFIATGAGAGTGIATPTVPDSRIELLISTTVSPSNLLAVTSITDSVVTGGSEFRLFKDMRDNTDMFSLSKSHKTILLQDVATDDDIIYLLDASRLTAPNLPIGEFGKLILNGETITFRDIDLGANTVSGLRRGAFGTGIHTHSTYDTVSDIGDDAKVEWDYNQIWYERDTVNSTASNGIPLQQQTTSPAIFIKK